MRDWRYCCDSDAASFLCKAERKEQVRYAGTCSGKENS